MNWEYKVHWTQVYTNNVLAGTACAFPTHLQLTWTSMFRMKVWMPFSRAKLNSCSLRRAATRKTPCNGQRQKQELAKKEMCANQSFHYSNCWIWKGIQQVLALALGLAIQEALIRWNMIFSVHRRMFSLLPWRLWTSYLITICFPRTSFFCSLLRNRSDPGETCLYTVTWSMASFYSVS